MKLKLFLVAVPLVLLLLLLASAVMAQGEPPEPYAGLQNPFPWDDTATQDAGKGLYQRSCLGCHGIEGNSIAAADFSAADFPQRLGERPDFYFWIISEGRLNAGMPPFKSSLPEDERWQILTYLRTLPGAAAEVTTPAEAPPEVVDATLSLQIPHEAETGQPVAISATLKDKEGKPVQKAPVQFLIKVDFFTSGLVKIGEATTNEQGAAVLVYTPEESGELEVVARYESIETRAKVSLTGSTESLYRAKVGIPEDDSFLPELFIGPPQALAPGESGAAPITGLRIPGGLPFLLLLAYVFTVILVWSLYIRVMYQLFRISVVGQRAELNIRLIPLIGMTMMTALVTLLVFILITGPYSHPHLPR